MTDTDINRGAPCVLFEDDDILAVDKPAGCNTHTPGPFHGEGIYDWLRAREPRWAPLGLHQRLDKETSGVLLFSLSAAARQELSRQFESRSVEKRYRFITDRSGRESKAEWTCRTTLVRVGDRAVSRPDGAAGKVAETRFRFVGQTRLGFEFEAVPRTGRTHQIRVHAADSGIPILGDALYGGTPAPRLYLHAAVLCFAHPVTGKPVTLRVEARFDRDTRESVRDAIVEAADTDVYRLRHGAADGSPGWYLERLGDYLLSQSDSPCTASQRDFLESMVEREGLAGAYHKVLRRDVGRQAGEASAPRLVCGEAAPEAFIVRENGLRFSIRIGEGYSVGLFCDQRDHRRRFLTGYVSHELGPIQTGSGAMEVLNLFSYTCGFSVAAARGGGRVTSVDLSKRYLDWGRENFRLNGIDPEDHTFLFGDAFDWMRRFGRRGRRFDVVILDPPTFSKSKDRGIFRAEKDYAELAAAAAEIIRPGGLLFASTNAARMEPQFFLDAVESGLAMSGRVSAARQYFPQPLDFPITRVEPAHLKTVWVRLD